MALFLLLCYLAGGALLAPHYKHFGGLYRVLYGIVFFWALPFACGWDNVVRFSKEFWHYLGYVVTFALWTGFVAFVAHETLYGTEGEMIGRFIFSTFLGMLLVGFGVTIFDHLGLLR